MLLEGVPRVMGGIPIPRGAAEHPVPSGVEMGEKRSFAEPAAKGGHPPCQN